MKNAQGKFMSLIDNKCQSVDLTPNLWNMNRCDYQYQLQFNGVRTIDVVCQENEHKNIHYQLQFMRSLSLLVGRKKPQIELRAWMFMATPSN